MKILRLAFPLLLCLALLSCKKKEPVAEEKPIGKWGDVIGLSQRNIEFTNQKSKILLTTKGDTWWVDELEFNGESMRADIQGTDGDFIIEKEAFRIKRKNLTEIHIEMSENKTGRERKLRIGLQDGNYFNSINVVQKK